jgi:hypothetical protein
MTLIESFFLSSGEKPIVTSIVKVLRALAREETTIGID